MKIVQNKIRSHLRVSRRMQKMKWKKYLKLATIKSQKGKIALKALMQTISANCMSLDLTLQTR